MNKETYEALKFIMNEIPTRKGFGEKNAKEYNESRIQIQNWIDEVAKEYTDCDCNMNYGNRDLQGVHDINCNSRNGIYENNIK